MNWEEFLFVSGPETNDPTDRSDKTSNFPKATLPPSGDAIDDSIQHMQPRTQERDESSRFD